MTSLSSSVAWSSGLPWLADFAPAMVGVEPRGDAASPATAVVVRRLGPRQQLAREAGVAESLGVDLVHAAVNELLAQHALPQVAVVGLAAPIAAGFGSEVVAGLVRACRSHGLPLHVPLAIPAEQVDVALTLAGVVTPSPSRPVAAGDVVLALRGRGPSDADLAPLLAVAARRGLRTGDPLANGEALARTLAAARASHASVMHDPVRLAWPFAGCAIGDGTLAGRLRGMLASVHDVVFDFSAWQPPSPFGAWFAGPEALLHAAATTSCGCDLALVVAAEDAARFLAHFAAWGEPGGVIGKVVTGRA